MDSHFFLRELGNQYAKELEQCGSIDSFTKNKQHIGAVAEAFVRGFLAKTVNPLRVSHGGVIDPELCKNPESLPQIDAIIWSPSPAPAAFERGDFGLVPRSSVFGVLEIKRSAYESLLFDDSKVLSSPNLLCADFIHAGNNDPLASVRNQTALGVVPVAFKDQQNEVSKLEQRKDIAILLQQQEDGRFLARTNDVFRLMNFLVACRWRARQSEGEVYARNRDLSDPVDTQQVPPSSTPDSGVPMVSLTGGMNTHVSNPSLQTGRRC